MTALAAPLFAVGTLGISAFAGINDALDILTIPNIKDHINLGPFSFVGDALDAVVNLFESAIRGFIYIILVIFFDQFLTAVKSQFIGSLTSIIFLVCLDQFDIIKATIYMHNIV